MTQTRKRMLRQTTQRFSPSQPVTLQSIVLQPDTWQLGMVWLRMVLAAVIMLSLSACGFHLRGESKLHTSFSTLSIEGREGQAFRQILVGKLEKSGVEIDSSAPYTILLLDEESERRVSAYSTRAKSAGFELKRTITFKIIGPSQKVEEVKETEMFSRRHLLFREDQVVGKQDEEVLLWQEMDQELAERIIRKLDSIYVEPVS